MNQTAPKNAPKAPAPKGATAARTTFKQRFESWREHHKEVALESLRRLMCHRPDPDTPLEETVRRGFAREDWICA